MYEQVNKTLRRYGIKEQMPVDGEKGEAPEAACEGLSGALDAGSPLVTGWLDELMGLASDTITAKRTNTKQKKVKPRWDAELRELQFGSWVKSYAKKKSG